MQGAGAAADRAGGALGQVAAVRAAFAGCPEQAALALEPVSQRAPKDPVVQFNPGSSLCCAGYLGEAAQAFRAAKTAGRDTYYEMRADEILHPQFFQPQDGIYPVFEQDGHDRLLLQGALLQRQGHQHSAERVYARAARLRPGDDEAHVAAAVAGSTRTTSRRRSRGSARSCSGSRAANPCATTWGCCSPGRGSATEASGSFAVPRPSRRRQARTAGECLPGGGLCQSGTKGAIKMSRSAYGVRPPAMRQFRIR